MISKFSKLKQKLKEAETLGLKFKDNVYYRFDKDKKYGPYCSCCYDYHDKLVNLHIKQDSENNNIYCCPKCKIVIEKGDEND